MAVNKVVEAINNIKAIRAYQMRPVGSPKLKHEQERVAPMAPMDSVQATVAPSVPEASLVINQPASPAAVDSLPIMLQPLPEVKRRVETQQQSSVPQLKLPGVTEAPETQIPLREPEALDWSNINDRRLLLDAQLYTESRYNSDAKNGSSGAQGIAQFMPRTWRDYQKRGIVPADKTPFDVDAALKGQRHFMEWAYNSDLAQTSVDDTDRTRMSLAMYNAGYGNVRDAIKAANDSEAEDSWEDHLPRRSETIPYMDKILKRVYSGRASKYSPKYNWGYPNS